MEHQTQPGLCGIRRPSGPRRGSTKANLTVQNWTSAKETWEGWT